MATKKTLGEKLRELRESYDLSQSQIASALNIDRSTYSNYELDRTQPNLETLVKLARIFNVPGEALLPEFDDEGTSFRELLPSHGMVNSLSKDERGMVAQFRALSAADRERIRSEIDDLANNSGK